MSYYRNDEEESYSQTDSYSSYDRRDGRGDYDDDSRYTQTTMTTYQDDDSYGGRGGRRYDDDSFTETTTTTTTYDDDRNYGRRPPPPQDLPRPWYAEWSDRDARWVFVNGDSGERRWDFPRGGDDYYERTEYVEEDRRRGGGHGLRDGVLGAVAGAFALREGENVYDDYERDRRRVEDVPDDAARWAGRKVGEVEAIPDDIENGFDRVGRRVEDGVDDVLDAPEDVAGWVGRKVGDVERFGDNVDDAYDEGRYEGRNDDRW